MEHNDELVLMKDITKVYGSQEVLKRVSFDLRRGEVHCLVGENGAGKSTLIKILSGAVTPEDGEIFINGQQASDLTPRSAMSLGISTVYQDAELVDSLTVADNVFLGDERLFRFPPIVNSRLQVSEARRIIDTLQMKLPADVFVEELSAAQKQELQIVKALYRNADIIIMDEPTSSLGQEETRALMKIVRSLKERGMGVIYISHHLEEIFEIGDRVTILKDGQHMGTHSISEVDMDLVIRKMVGRKASSFFSRKPVEIGETQVEIDGLTQTNVIEDVSFSVRAGEIFGIGGLVGSGRSELVNLIFGAEKPDRGTVYINGRRVKPKSPRRAIRAGMGLVTEDRKRLGILVGRDIVENMAVVHNEVFKGPLIDGKEEDRLTNKMVNELSIVASREDQTLEELSGGNQQKVIIGRWLLDDATLYIFDEPTKGVDIGAKEQIYDLLVELAERGKSIIMISSDMPELISMSDRIGIMREGHMVEIVEAKGIEEEELLRSFIGIDDSGGK
jgi:ribose transport system ATP-binding protein